MSELLHTLLNAKISQQNISVREAARSIGISHSTLERFLDGKMRPNIDSTVLISRWLGVDPSVIIENSGPSGRRDDVTEFLSAYPELLDLFRDVLNGIKNNEVAPDIVNELIQYIRFKLSYKDSAWRDKNKTE